MKNWRKILACLLAVCMALSMAACSGGTEDTSKTEEPVVEETTEEPVEEEPTEAPTEEPVEEEPTEAPTEEPVEEEPTEAPTEEPVEEEPTEAPTEEPVEEEPTEAPVEETAEEETPDAEVNLEQTPRNETLYLGGMQSGKPNDANIFSPSSTLMVQSQSDVADEVTYETLYMYNLLDGEIYPLLADGEPEYSEDLKTITVHLKEAAHWSDGTPVTAEDVAVTFKTHVDVASNIGGDFGQYISEIEAVDEHTIIIKANEEKFNPLKMKQYLTFVYVGQAAYINSKLDEYNGDSEKFKTDTWWDAPHSGPYTIAIHSEEKCVYVRDDNYWGQDASMWGELPHPKYICHNIYSGNDTLAVAFEAGEIDANQQFVANVWTYWEDKGLPISTYLDEPPYYIDASIPTIFYNCTLEGLDQVEVRKAIAMAIDYDQIITAAMSGYSYTFAEVPHSLFNPSAPEQEMYEKCNAVTDLAALNFAGKDIKGANKLLDDAGIVDTDGDGYREYNGKNLEFNCECPAGFSDWNAALEIVAAAGQNIGINLQTYFPEVAVWNEDIQTGGFEIIMSSSLGVGISNPWARAYNLIYGWGGEFPERLTNGYSRWYNEEVDQILADIPVTTDEEELTKMWARINEIYLTEVPSVGLMYRPQMFHEVNEIVWTGFPEANDGTNIPPTVCVGGYGIAALYHITPVEG